MYEIQGDGLAEMQRQYQYATVETHILVDGVLHLRCLKCGEKPVPLNWSFVCLCDPCLKERIGDV